MSQKQDNEAENKRRPSRRQPRWRTRGRAGPWEPDSTSASAGDRDSRRRSDCISNARSWGATRKAFTPMNTKGKNLTARKPVAWRETPAASGGLHYGYSYDYVKRIQRALRAGEGKEKTPNRHRRWLWDTCTGFRGHATLTCSCQECGAASLSCGPRRAPSWPRASTRTSPGSRRC